jgi:NTP pyrophosphatase (non-canonical NTP hydrolase)
MNLSQLAKLALEIRKNYCTLEKQKFGQEWNREDIAIGLVGDVGDLMKLVLAEKGIRNIENSRDKIGHELSDILWSILILSSEYNIDLEKEFIKTMNSILTKLDRQKKEQKDHL